MLVHNLSHLSHLSHLSISGTPGTNLSLVTIVDIINYLVNDSAYPDVFFLRKESDFIPGFRSDRNGCLHPLFGWSDGFPSASDSLSSSILNLIHIYSSFFSQNTLPYKSHSCLQSCLPSIGVSQPLLWHT